MDRRRFLRNLVSGATALALAPPLLHGARALAGESSVFAAGLERHPWLAGWKSVAGESLAPTGLELQGRLPDGFAGTLYRNGPALFERDGFRYEHWFDGDGMVQRWNFHGGRATHSARMVATPKYRREHRAGRFRTIAAGTTVPDAQPVRNNDDASTANTSVMVLDGRLFALQEAGSAFELEPDSLQTLGPVTFREDLAGVPFSAHPLRDRDGSVWNFGAIALLGGSGLLVWHLDAAGKLLTATTLDTPRQGYLHSFAMTDRHLVFVLVPFRYQQAGAFFERLRFTEEQACSVAVVDKDAPDRARWFEVDFAAIYHFGDAFERDGRIVVRTVRHGNVEAARSPMQGPVNGRAEAVDTEAELAELHLDLRSGRAHWQETGLRDIEFPMFDPRAPSDRGARLFAPTREGPRSTPYFNAVASLDPDRGRRQVHGYGAAVMAEEHVFVPRPGSTRPGDGWLVGTLLDSARGRSGIAVLDAQRVQDGPLAQAWLPYTVPLGFHGTFAAR
jgi:carotenoid cleavage dioxygenase-like enzyme